MNLSLIFHLIGTVLVIESLSMLLPAAASYYYGGDDLPAILISFLLTAVSGVLLYVVTRSHRAENLKHRDGFLVVTLGWLFVSFYGSLPYLVSGHIASFTDASFESMAGFTTTGASVLSNIEALPRGLLLWRSLTQWIGGMGIILFALAIMPFLGAGGTQLFKAEVPELTVDRLRPRIVDTAKALWYIYASLTAVAMLFYRLGGMDLFDALNHGFTTLATGGFSTRNASLAYFDSLFIDNISTLFMFMAGINYTLYFYAFRGDLSKFHRSSEFRFYLGVVLTATTLLTLKNLGIYSSVAESFRYSSFQVVSIITTTGYATADYEAWAPFSKFLLLFLMFFGGMIGSTGGGMKQVRVLLMLKQGYRELYQLIHPHAVTSLKLDNRFIEKEVLGGIWGFLFLFLSIGALATLGMALLGVDMVTAASTVISAMSNVGPALGLAGPTDNYAGLPDAGKWILMFCMLAGRLEIYTVIILFVPHFYKK